MKSQLIKFSSAMNSWRVVGAMAMMFFLVGISPLEAQVKKPVMKYDFSGKLVSVEKYAAGRGAAAGKFIQYKLKFKVSHVWQGELKVGDFVFCDQSTAPRYHTDVKAVNAKVGSVYRVTSPYKHPAHPIDPYLLEVRLSKPAREGEVLEEMSGEEIGEEKKEDSQKKEGREKKHDRKKKEGR